LSSPCSRSSTSGARRTSKCGRTVARSIQRSASHRGGRCQGFAEGLQELKLSAQFPLNVCIDRQPNCAQPTRCLQSKADVQSALSEETPIHRATSRRHHTILCEGVDLELAGPINGPEACTELWVLGGDTVRKLCRGITDTKPPQHHPGARSAEVVHPQLRDAPGVGGDVLRRATTGHPLHRAGDEVTQALLDVAAASEVEVGEQGARLRL